MSDCNSHPGYPTGDGTAVDWPPSGAESVVLCIDAPSADYGDAKYVSVNLDAAVCGVTHGLVAAGQTCGPKRVVVFARVKDPSANTEAIQLGLYISGTWYWSADKATSSNTVYNEYTEAWLTNPNTGGVWTWAAIESLHMGIKRRALSAPTGLSAGGLVFFNQLQTYVGAPRCSQLQLIVFCDSQ